MKSLFGRRSAIVTVVIAAAALTIQLAKPQETAVLMQLLCMLGAVTQLQHKYLQK